MLRLETLNAVRQYYVGAQRIYIVRVNSSRPLVIEIAWGRPEASTYAPMKIE
jgi:hypothetical protein